MAVKIGDKTGKAKVGKLKVGETVSYEKQSLKGYTSPNWKHGTKATTNWG